MTDGKWFCRCGQANAAHLDKCVNCNSSASEGSNKAYSLDDVRSSGIQMARGRFAGEVISRPVKKVRIREYEDRIVVTETKPVVWLIFTVLLLGTTSVTFLLYEALAPDKGALASFLLIVFFIGAPSLLIGIFSAFPHSRLEINGTWLWCRAEKRWLCFTYRRTEFSLNEYYIAQGNHVQEKEEQEFNPLLGVLTLFTVLHTIRKYNERIPAISVTTGPQGEVWNLISLEDQDSVDRIMKAATRMIPDRVLTSGD